MHGQAFVAVEEKRSISLIRIAMEIRNDHDGKLEALGLVNCHQPHDVCCLVHLAFAFAAADRFKLLDIMHKVADQKTDLLKLLSQAKKLFHIRDPLGAIKVRGDHGHVLGRLHRETQQVRDSISIAAGD